MLIRGENFKTKHEGEIIVRGRLQRLINIWQEEGFRAVIRRALHTASYKLAWKLPDFLDYVSRFLQGKLYLPPRSLMINVTNPPAHFERIGSEFLVYLKLLARLKPNENILDIGCGCGMMALQLSEYLSSSGKYVGMDINKRVLDWCKKNIHQPNYEFYWVNIYNEWYNPKGSQRGSDYIFPFDDNTYDVILLKSVFTHMRPRELEQYLKEIERLLKKDGRCLATFYLLNSEQKRLAEIGKNIVDFPFEDNNYRYVSDKAPEALVGYREAYILELARKYGLRSSEIQYGYWSGRRDGLSKQDIMVLVREADIQCLT